MGFQKFFYCFFLLLFSISLLFFGNSKQVLADCNTTNYSSNCSGLNGVGKCEGGFCQKSGPGCISMTGFNPDSSCPEGCSHFVETDCGSTCSCGPGSICTGKCAMGSLGPAGTDMSGNWLDPFTYNNTPICDLQGNQGSCEDIHAGAPPYSCRRVSSDPTLTQFGNVCWGSCVWKPAGTCYSACALPSGTTCGQPTCTDGCGTQTNCGSWVSCTPSTGIIQGFKVVMPGNQNIAPAAGQTVSLDGGSPTTANPYFFTNVSASAHTVSISVPSGYSAGYTLCYNSTGCHTGTPTTGSSVSVTVPAGGYADLWWHFTPPPPTCTVSLSTSTPTISVGSTALVTANVTTTPAGTTISGIDWLSSNTTVGTIFAHTVQDIVSNNVLGKAAGTTNISATVNPSPSGSCSTTTPLGITVYPRSWWQVTGGDVYVGGGNVVSSIPSTCTQNCYIDLAN